MTRVALQCLGCGDLIEERPFVVVTCRCGQAWIESYPSAPRVSYGSRGDYQRWDVDPKSGYMTRVCTRAKGHDMANSAEGQDMDRLQEQLSPHQDVSRPMRILDFFQVRGALDQRPEFIKEMDVASVAALRECMGLPPTEAPSPAPDVIVGFLGELTEADVKRLQRDLQRLSGRDAPVPDVPDAHPSGMTFGQPVDRVRLAEAMRLVHDVAEMSEHMRSRDVRRQLSEALVILRDVYGVPVREGDSGHGSV